MLTSADWLFLLTHPSPTEQNALSFSSHNQCNVEPLTPGTEGKLSHSDPDFIYIFDILCIVKLG